jgi:pimeloyl-ACP methyl ester carboxylesterase
MSVKIEVGLLDDRVPYIRGGSGEREALVLFGVNALFKRLDQTANPGRYADQVKCLLPGYRFTILGYAASSFDAIVGDVALAVRNPPNIVVGISLGGFVALRLAAQHPELVKRLVLLSSAHCFSAQGRRMLARQFAALEKGDIRTLIRENALLFRRPWYNWLVRFKVWLAGARLAAEIRDPAAILHDYRHLFGPDFENNANYGQRIQCPTLVIGGTADQLFGRNEFEETARLIPGARAQLFDDETHMLPIERRKNIAEAIASFVRTV